jgi:molybdopterin converting factor small subunit
VVRVRLFASLREMAGAPFVEAEATTAGGVVDELAMRFGERFARLARSGSVVVDGERADADRALEGSEEVALLPPVSGG